MARQYARGRHALGECQRSGKRVPYRDLVEDGHIPGLLVARDWWEPQHPQEIPPDMTDPVALRRPSPEISVDADEGNAELGGAGACAASPNSDTYLQSTTLAAALSADDTHVPLTDAANYDIGECIYIQRDNGTWYVSKATSGTNGSPQYTVQLTTGVTLVGSGFSAGNAVYIGVNGSGVPVPVPMVELLEIMDPMQATNTNISNTFDFGALPAGTDNRLIVVVAMTQALSNENVIDIEYSGIPMAIQIVHSVEFSVGIAIGLLHVAGNLPFANTNVEVIRDAAPSSSKKMAAQVFVFDNVNADDSNFTYRVDSAETASPGSADPLALDAFSLSEGDLVFTSCIADGNDIDDPVLTDDTGFSAYEPLSFPGAMGTPLNNQAMRMAYRIMDADGSVTVSWEPETTGADLIWVQAFAVRAEEA